MIDRIMEMPGYRFYCHEQIRTELTRHNIGNSTEWLETKISDESVHCISDEEIFERSALSKGERFLSGTFGLPAVRKE